MADNPVVVEIVSDFFHNTCRLSCQLNLKNLAVIIHASDIVSAGNDEVDIIPLSTGSVAEIVSDFFHH